MNSFKVVKGDLFEHIKWKGGIIIPHVVNDKGAWGAGFVIPLGKNFPEAKQYYLDWVDGNFMLPFRMGLTQMVECDNEVYVANMCAQTLGGERPLNYGALVACMEEVEANCVGEEIHCPMFGSALAGGNWEFISCLIDDIWGELDVTVYQL